MDIIEGLTTLASEDKGTKAGETKEAKEEKRGGTGEMNKLMKDVLAALKTSIPVAIKQEKASVKEKPTASDVAGYAGNIYASIPAGFLLLHNDLETLIAKLSAGAASASGASSGGAALSGKAALIAGAGAAVGSIAGSLFNGFSSKQDKHMQGIVDELNANLTADDFRDDPAVQAQQKQGFIEYLKAYYTQQSAALIASGVTGGIAEGAINGVVAGLGNLFNKLAGKEGEVNKLESIVNDIMDAETSDKYLNDPEVIEATKNGIIGYLKTYFITQATAMGADAVIGGIGAAAGDAVGSFLKGVFTLGSSKTENKSYGTIQGIIDDIIEAQVSSNYIDDPEVANSTKEGILGYLKAYFKSQTIAATSDTVASGTAGAAGNAVGSFLKGIFTLGSTKTENRSYGKIQGIIEDIIEAQASDNYINDPLIKIATKEGVASYLKAYFKSQAIAAASDTVGESIGTGAANAVKGFFSGLFSSKEDDKSSPEYKIQSILADIIKSQSSNMYINDADIKEEAKNGMIGYLKTYFKTQSAALAVADFTNQSYAINSQISESFANAVGNIIADVNLASDPDIKEVLYQISGTLQNLNALVGNISESGGNMIVVNNAAAGTNPSIEG